MKKQLTIEIKPAMEILVQSQKRAKTGNNVVLSIEQLNSLISKYALFAMLTCCDSIKNQKNRREVKQAVIRLDEVWGTGVLKEALAMENLLSNLKEESGI